MYMRYIAFPSSTSVENHSQCIDVDTSKVSEISEKSK